MIEKLIATGILTFGSAAMIFARRYENKDTQAGIGIAGWIIIILLFMWT